MVQRSVFFSSAHRLYLVQTKPCHTDGICKVRIIQLFIEVNIHLPSSTVPDLAADMAGRTRERDRLLGEENSLAFAKLTVWGERI